MIVPPPRDSWADALAEAEPYRNADFLAHYQGLEQACRLTATILENHPNRETILEYIEPLPPESIALIKQLQKR
ncbi:MAG: hypothetical protein JW841_10495 [Deltaproteobacteria bacterium]|nr:hypothetical protein [Deltaproteobacteria bacterium]